MGDFNLPNIDWGNHAIKPNSYRTLAANMSMGKNIEARLREITKIADNQYNLDLDQANRLQNRYLH